MPIIQRQVRLPLSQAIQIAWKPIRLRLGRSLLVISGIVLALAFLMAILTSEAMIAAMRHWALAGADAAPELRRQRDHLAQQQADRAAQIRALASAAPTAPAPAGSPAPPGSLDSIFKAHGAARQDLGALPLPEPELLSALAAHPMLRKPLDQWIDASLDQARISRKLTAPQRLASMMKANGIPMTPGEIAAARIQNRWLLGLALLVAFVGILNAMLMSVTERFREIGTMKCLGALDSFIIKLFLLESLFQGLVGTLAGILIGIGLSLASISATYGDLAWRNLPASALLLNVIIGLAIGITLTVAGALYPAWQAARMQPIEAMRAEI